MPKVVFDFCFPARCLKELLKIQEQAEHPFVISEISKGYSPDGKTQAYEFVILEFDVESIPSVKQALDFIVKNFESAPEGKTLVPKPLQPRSD